MDVFTAKEVSRLAGFEKPWMLNHLERERIFIPEMKRGRHHGKYRSYTFRDVVVLRAINRLLTLGARPRRIRDSIETFERVCPSTDNGDAMLEFARKASFFVITKDKVLYCESPENLVDLAKKGQLTFSFMVGTDEGISPSVKAGIAYLRQVEEGAARGEALLKKTAKKYRLIGS